MERPSTHQYFRVITSMDFAALIFGLKSSSCQLCNYKPLTCLFCTSVFHLLSGMIFIVSNSWVIMRVK
jgi:hypothetical protein